MSNKIVLNLSNIDFDDNFNFDNGELWQQQAGESLVKNLVTIGHQAKAYSKRRESEKQPLAMHDAIFISGGRGAGKTVFLKNAEKVWDKAAESKDISLYFTPAIDPTLLINHDNFTNVVVAQLYNEVEKAFNKPCKQLDIYKTDFYSKLKQLADSLGQESDYEDRMGIDRILKYRSGIQVERFFHDYVEVCTKILGAAAIVIPIDDVDMALGRAYEVLDVVRRMLGCPFIIPLVSGDEALYQHMVKQHFLDDVSLNQSTSASTSGFENVALANRLTNAYLTKVLPSNLRISLLPIDTLLNKLEIKEDGRDEIDFNEYCEHFHTIFYGMTNGEEKSANWPKPSNAREVVQLLSLFPPSSLDVKANTDCWIYLRNWAQMKKSGETLVLADSALYLSDNSNSFRLLDLMMFNPLKQVKESLDWVEKDFYGEQKKALEQLESKSSNKKNNQIDLLSSFKDKKIFNCIPPLEFYTQKLTIPHKEIASVPSKNNVLLSIYAYQGYYGSSGSTIHQVFFSRSFEILALSLLTPKMVGSRREERKFKKIFDSPPFYSLYSMAPTKFIELDADDSTSTIEDVDDLQSVNISSFVCEIVEWHKKHLETLTGFQENAPLALLHSVFNKTFTQLHLLRCESNKLVDESLTTIVKRFEYILINAFASFMKPSGVINANIAKTPNTDNIKDFDKFRVQETVFVRNVEHFIGQKTGDSKSGYAEPKSRLFVKYYRNEIELLRAIWDHPIFEIVGNNTPSSFKLKASPVTQKHNSDKSDKSKKRPKVITDAFKAAGSHRLDIEAWEHWANSSRVEFDNHIQSIVKWRKQSKANNDALNNLMPVYVDFYHWLKNASNSRLL